MKLVDPDTLRLVSGEELLDRQRNTGELGDGRTVICRPNLMDQNVIQQVARSVCLATPYQACFNCPHHRFEFIFAIPAQNDWVQCPRWKRETTGPPSFYTPVWLSECRVRPHAFCQQCPSREELVQLLTDKQKEGWLERYRKLTKEE